MKTYVGSEGMGKDSGTLRIEGWVGPRACLDAVTIKKNPFQPPEEIEPRSSSPWPLYFMLCSYDTQNGVRVNSTLIRYNNSETRHIAHLYL
jgi:hypothetical protein